MGCRVLAVRGGEGGDCHGDHCNSWGKGSRIASGGSKRRGLQGDTCLRILVNGGIVAGISSEGTRSDTMSASTTRICRLCLQDREMRKSHIFSKFFYKHFIGDQNKSGQFVDLGNKNPRSSKQLTREWLCDECEKILGDSESTVACELIRMEREQAYELLNRGKLLHFAVSISWRVMNIEFEIVSRTLLEQTFPAVKCWRNFLRGNRNNLSYYTNHLFLAPDYKNGMHRTLDRLVSPDGNIVISFAGPLIIVGLLDSRRFTPGEMEIWKRSEIRPESSLMKSIDVWRANQNITLNCLRLMTDRIQLNAHAVRQMASELGITKL